MNEKLAAQAQELRPNPFAFTSDTTSRFALLVAGMIGTVSTVWERLWLELDSERAFAVLSHCRTVSPPPVFRLDRSRAASDYHYWWETYDNYLAEFERYRQCLSPVFGLPQATAALTGVMAAAALAAFLYLMWPGWKIRRHRLQMVDPATLGSLGTELTNLQRLAGPVHVSWLLDAHNPHQGALAFGRVGKRYVLLQGGLMREGLRDPSVLRAVVRHEIAHIRNSDIDKAYLTVAMGYATTALGLLPFAILLIIDMARVGDVGHWTDAVRVSVLATLVLLACTGTLRARESYADLRAATWDEEGERGLERILTASEHVQRTKSWPAALRWHPSVIARRQVVENPQLALRLGFWQALAVGLVATVGTEAFRSVATGLDLPPWSLVGILFGPLIAGFVGLAMWRAAYADHVAGRSLALRPARVGLGLGIGLALGPVFQVGRGGLWQTSLGGLPSLFTMVTANMLLVVAMMALVRWLAVASAAWMPGVLRSRSPRPTALLAFACFSVVCGVVAASALNLRLQTVVHSGAGVPNTFVNTVGRSFFPIEGESLWIAAMVMLLTVLLWLYPLLGARRSANGAIAAWATLEHQAVDWSKADQADVRLSSALRTGFTTAALIFSVLLAYRLTSEQWGAGADVELGVWLGTLLVVGVGVQALTGIVVALRAPAYRISHALGAAFTAGVTASAGIVVSGLAEGLRPSKQQDWTLDLADLLRLVDIVLRPGAMATLLSASIALLIASGCRRVVIRDRSYTELHEGSKRAEVRRDR
jgi:Zn-dependent protease with chaperone function